MDKSEDELRELLIKDNGHPPGEPEDYTAPDDELTGARRSLLQATSIDWVSAGKVRLLGNAMHINKQTNQGSAE